MKKFTIVIIVLIFMALFFLFYARNSIAPTLPKNNEVEAVVFDSPVLVYYALNDGVNWAEVVGELFDKQDYGVVLQEDSNLLEKINRAVLNVRENGYYNTLYKKYFGETE